MIEKIATVTPYQGVLADLDEITDTTEYPTGSIFHAIDTGDEYVRYADGWVLDLRKAAAIKRSLML
jgi:hypothetical protein